MSANHGNATSVPSVGILLTVIAGISLGLMLVAPAMFVLVFCGMAPTFIAMFISIGRSRHTLPCMASLNFAGLLPVIGMLWERGNTLGAAADLLQDVFVLALMYGAAGLSMFLLWAMPLCVRAVLESIARQQRWRIEHVQDKLLEEWGEQLRSDADADGDEVG